MSLNKLSLNKLSLNKLSSTNLSLNKLSSTNLSLNKLSSTSIDKLSLNNPINLYQDWISVDEIDLYLLYSMNHCKQHIIYELGIQIDTFNSLSHLLQQAINVNPPTILFSLQKHPNYKQKNISLKEINSAMYLSNLTIFSFFQTHTLLPNKIPSSFPPYRQLVYELQTLSYFNGGVIIYSGAYKDKKEGLKWISEYINKFKFPKNSKLIIENSSDNSLCKTIHDFQQLISQILPEKLIHFGISLNTAHLYITGQYNLSLFKSINKLMNNIRDLPVCLVRCLDTTTKFNSNNKAIYTNIGKGNIWGENLESFYQLIRICKRRKIPMIGSSEDYFTVPLLRAMNIERIELRL